MKEETNNAIYYIRKSFELKNLKLYKEAVEMLYKALSCDDIGDKNVEIIAQIGDLYMLLKNYDRAIEQYEKVLDNDDLHMHSLRQLCEIYFILQKYTKALDIAKNLCSKFPSEDNYMNYFKVLFKLNLFDEIKILYEDLKDKVLENDEIMYIVSKTDYAERFELLEKIIAINPERLEAMVDLGVLCFEKEDFKYAKKLFETVIAAEDSSVSYYYLGLIYSRKGEYTNAIDCFLKAIRYDKTNANNYYFELAKAYCDINWLNEAQIALLRSLSILSATTPDDESVDEHYFLLAWIYSKKNDVKNALLNLDMIDKTSLVYNKAQILKNVLKFNEGNIIEAKQGLEKLYEANKDNSMLYSTLGMIYKELKFYKKGAEIYKEALQVFPESVNYFSELIDILIDNKEYDEARKYANVFLEKYSECPSAHNSLARIYYREEKYTEALLELQKLTELDKNNAEAYYFTGLVLNDMIKPFEAIKYLTTALNLNPTKAKYYAQAARAHVLMEQYSDARLFIKEAIELAPGEILYKKQALCIANALGNKDEEIFYENIVKNSEDLIKFKRQI